MGEFSGMNAIHIITPENVLTNCMYNILYLSKKEETENIFVIRQLDFVYQQEAKMHFK